MATQPCWSNNAVPCPVSLRRAEPHPPTFSSRHHRRLRRANLPPAFSALAHGLGIACSILQTRQKERGKAGPAPDPRRQGGKARGDPRAGPKSLAKASSTHGAMLARWLVRSTYPLGALYLVTNRHDEADQT